MNKQQYDIFLSYSRQNIDRARWFIDLFEGKGFSVFWDLTSIPPGITFHQFIRQSLDSSRCVVVLWTEASVNSKWVDIEAREGNERDVLFPVLLDDLKKDQLPFGLHMINATALYDWDGKSSHRNLDLLLRTLHSRLGKKESPRKTEETPKQTQKEPEQLLALRKPLSVFRDRFKNGSEGPKMVFIDSGSFRMGDIEGFGSEVEKPPHDVKITKAFLIGHYPVTFDEYGRFVERTGHDLPDHRGWGRGTRPVINVSWEDAVAYTEWMSMEMGKRYRLPTEAEWEYACRAGTETRWSFRDNKGELDAYAWYAKNSTGKTHKIGEKNPNPWGLYDMHGNVWEWVQDCWHDNYHDAPGDGSAWLEADRGDCTQRVIRGGSWNHVPKYLRSAFRDCKYLGYRLNNIGFRLAKDL